MPWGQKKLTMHEQRFLPSGLLFQHCLEGLTRAGRRKINKRWRTERKGQTGYRDWIPVYLHHFYFLLPAQSSAHCSQASCYPALKTSLIKDTRLPNLTDESEVFPHLLSSGLPGQDSAFSGCFASVRSTGSLPQVEFNPLISKDTPLKWCLLLQPGSPCWTQVTPNLKIPKFLLD